MREIKFRAWSRGKMHYFDLFANDQYYLLGQDEGNIEFNAPVMQYTGLKDGNGVEIYEGDILELVYGIPPIKAILTVVKRDAAFKTICKNAQPKELYLGELKLELDIMEVIGNIYENPELLN